MKIKYKLFYEILKSFKNIIHLLIKKNIAIIKKTYYLNYIIKIQSKLKSIKVI